MDIKDFRASSICGQLGKILDGNYMGNFCLVESLNDNDFMVYIINDKKEILDSFYCENPKALCSTLNFNLDFEQYLYEVLNEQTILRDFNASFGKTDIEDYLPRTQKVIKLLCEIIKNKAVNKAIKEILNDYPCIDLTSTPLIAEALIDKEIYKKLPKNIKSKIQELLEIRWQA